MRSHRSTNKSEAYLSLISHSSSLRRRKAKNASNALYKPAVQSSLHRLSKRSQSFGGLLQSNRSSFWQNSSILASESKRRSVNKQRARASGILEKERKRKRLDKEKQLVEIKKELLMVDEWLSRKKYGKGIF